MDISADEIDFNSDTNWANARGHVHLRHFASKDDIKADRADYNIKTHEGKFYNVEGTSPAKVMTSPGVLTTTNPFYFHAEWAERINDRYILHNGYMTDCHIPKPWWTFGSPLFDVIPGDRAIGHRTVFRLKNIPVFFFPYYYRPLGKNPRQSGFLTPEIGHSSFYGYLYGAGYYWAMSRSYDMTGYLRYFSQRGPAYLYDFRGKPTKNTDFDFNLYDVDDRGVSQGGGTPLKEGGLEFELRATSYFDGFTAHLDYTYLSSFLFRQAFSYNFVTAIYNQINSIGYLQRHFDNGLYTLTFAGQRDQLYEATTLINQRQNQVVLEKLPSVELTSRDTEIAETRSLPVWFGFSTSASLLDRQEPGCTQVGSLCYQSGGSPPSIFSTGAYGRVDFEPHVYTAFSFRGFTLEPSISLGATDYSNSYARNSTGYTSESSCGGYPSCPPAPYYNISLAGANLFRKNADFTLDLHAPALERIYTPPEWLHLNGKVKHVIEAEAQYEYVTGINEFQRIIHYDQTDILSNTNQLAMYLTNRLLQKDKSGNVSEFLTWRLAYARYFDPTFGGAVLAPAVGSTIRNVVLATDELTPFPFLDGPRTYSPIVSWLTVNPRSFLGLDWRTDYDPIRRKTIDHNFAVSFRRGNYFASVGENAISTNPVLVPQANQLSFGGGYGSTNRKGWNVAGTVLYDVLLSRTIFEFVQSSYNTDCCGFSFQIRHLNFGIRNDNQYLFSFSVANIGTFGSLQKQSRIF